jgi:hypothetical protein
MTSWTTAQMRSWPTKDPRVRVADFGFENWRTMVPGNGVRWAVTGPPYATKRAAYEAVDDVLADYFGEGPTRAQLAARIERAVAISRDAWSPDSTEFPRQVITRMVQALGYTPEQVAQADDQAS